MTPEKALGILEGKIPRDLPAEIIEEKKPQPSKKKITVKNPMTMDLPYLPIMAVLVMTLAVIAVYYRSMAMVSESAYKNGYNQGMATINPDLILAQKEVGDKALEINGLKMQLSKANEINSQLQRDLAATEKDLESMTAQKDHLTQHLKQTQESIPKKIKAVEQVLGDKIKRIKDKSQKKITLYNQALSSAEHDINDQEKELNGLRKQVIEAQEQRNQALDVISQRETQISKLQKQLESVQSKIDKSALPWQQETASLKQNLNSLAAEKDELTQRLKELQSQPKSDANACMSR